MKNNKNKTISEAAAQAMGLGDYDATGKGSVDATGKGSMTAAPVAAAPVAVPGIPAPIVPNSMPGMKKAAAPVTTNNSEEEEESDENEATEVEESTEVDQEAEALAEQAREQFRAALVSLLGEENASEELVSRLEAIFEAAVSDRVEKTVETIVEGVDNNVKDYLETVTETLVEKVDDYLDYIVEEWITDNAVAVEQGIKTQIAENFISGLKNLFENHYIDVPNEKYNVLDELYAQNRELEAKLNEAVNVNINLKKQGELTECAGIFVAATRDMADTQVAKLQNLMENVSFGSPEEYRQKLIAIKDNYLNTSKVSAPARSVEPEQTFAAVKGNPTTLVEGYVGALGRLNKKV
jgi:ribosomal protein S25